MNILVRKFEESLVQGVWFFVYIGMNNVESGLCDWSNHTLGSLTGPHMETELHIQIFLWIK